MSLLLDALNKADKERKKNQSSPSIDSQHVQPAPQKSSLRLVLLVSLVAAIVASVSSYLFYSTNRAPANLPNMGSTTAITANTVVAAENAKENSNIQNNLTRTQTAPENTGVESANSLNAKPKVESTQKIADLYQQSAPHSTEKQIHSASAENSGNSENSGKAVGSISSINQFANIPELHDLPDTVLTKIPSMKYTEHHFNKLTTSELGGSIMINGSLKHANDQLVDGVYLDKILEDGIVLHFENYSFKMHALNSWVNM